MTQYTIYLHVCYKTNYIHNRCNVKVNDTSLFNKFKTMMLFAQLSFLKCMCYPVEPCSAQPLAALMRNNSNNNNFVYVCMFCCIVMESFHRNVHYLRKSFMNTNDILKMQRDTESWEQNKIVFVSSSIQHQSNNWKIINLWTLINTWRKE